MPERMTIKYAGGGPFDGVVEQIEIEEGDTLPPTIKKGHGYRYDLDTQNAVEGADAQYVFRGRP